MGCYKDNNITYEGIQLSLLIFIVVALTASYFLYYMPKYKKRLMKDANIQNKLDARFII